MDKEQAEKAAQKGKRLFWAVCVGVLIYFYWFLINTHGVAPLHH